MFATPPSRATFGRQIVHLAAIVGLAAGLPACGKKSPEGQTVATVNGEDITQSELNLELASAGVSAANKELAQQQVLQAMIDRKLIAQQAIKDGVDKNPQFVLAERRMREILIAQRAVQSAAAGMNQPPSENEINTYLEKHPTVGEQRKILEIDQIKFKAPRNAAEAKVLEPAKTMDQLVALLTARGEPLERGRAELDTANIPDDALAKLRSMKNGEPLVAVQGGLAIANVIVGERPAGSSMDAVEIAKQRVINDRMMTAMRRRQDALRKDAKIDYAAGFRPKTAAGAPATK